MIRLLLSFQGGLSHSGRPGLPASSGRPWGGHAAREGSRRARTDALAWPSVQVEEKLLRESSLLFQDPGRPLFIGQLCLGGVLMACLSDILHIKQAKPAIS